MGHNFLEWAKSNFPLRQMKIASFIPLLCHFFPKLCLRLIPHLPAFILFCILILLKASRPLRSTKLARHSCRIPFMPHLVCVDGSWMLNGGWMVGWLDFWVVGWFGTVWERRPYQFTHRKARSSNIGGNKRMRPDSVWFAPSQREFNNCKHIPRWYIPWINYTEGHANCWLFRN